MKHKIESYFLKIGLYFFLVNNSQACHNISIFSLDTATFGKNNIRKIKFFESLQVESLKHRTTIINYKNLRVRAKKVLRQNIIITVGCPFRNSYLISLFSLFVNQSKFNVQSVCDSCYTFGSTGIGWNYDCVLPFFNVLADPLEHSWFSIQIVNLKVCIQNSFIPSSQEKIYIRHKYQMWHENEFDFEKTICS